MRDMAGDIKLTMFAIGRHSSDYIFVKIECHMYVCTMNADYQSVSPATARCAVNNDSPL